MSSSSGPPPPEPDDNHDNEIPVNDEQFIQNIDTLENPPAWRYNRNEPGDADDGSAEHEQHEEEVEDDHNEVDDEDDSEVGGEILYEISEEDRPGSSSRSRRRGRNRRSARDRCPECRSLMDQWRREVNERDATIAQRDQTIRELENDIRVLQEQRKLHWTPWRGAMRDFLDDYRARDPDDDDTSYLEPYEAICREACSQGIMSQNPRIVHPDLMIELVPYTQAYVQRYFDMQQRRDRYGVNFFHPSLRVAEILGPIVYQAEPDLPRALPLLLENAPFRFEDLPTDIQCHIWKMLIPSHELVHCLSRPDPKNPSCFAPGPVRYPNRFHIGQEDCSITKADKPSRYLDYFLVSKRWYYVTAHLFYATNTFAFSSLGEYGRFCDGIRRARVERLVHLEFLWHGALTPREDNKVSLRTTPLRWFMYTSSLRTLAIHIDESSKSRMRRPYELREAKDYYKDFGDPELDENDLNIFGMECRRTDLQPNYRKNRSLRTVQGIDFIYQLRGMNWVRFYDFAIERTRTKIRDWTFVQDINNAARRKKSDQMALKAEFENLLPLTGLADYMPADDDFELAKAFYDNTPVDVISVGGSDTSSNASGSTFSSDSSSSNSDDDSEGPSSLRYSYSPPPSRDVVEIDDDEDMDDVGDVRDVDDPQNSDTDSSDAMSDSGRSLLRDQDNSDPQSSGLNTSIYSQPEHLIIEDSENPEVIVIPDDEESADQNARYTRTYRDGNGSSTDGLFVRRGSCSAPSGRENFTTDDEDRELARRLPSRPNIVIDLSNDDDDSDNLFVRSGSCSAPSPSPPPRSNRTPSAVPGYAVGEIVDLTLDDDDNGYNQIQPMDVDSPREFKTESTPDSDVKVEDTFSENGHFNEVYRDADDQPGPSSPAGLRGAGTRTPSRPSLSQGPNFDLVDDTSDDEIELGSFSSKRPRDGDDSD